VGKDFSGVVQSRKKIGKGGKNKGHGIARGRERASGGGRGVRGGRGLAGRRWPLRRTRKKVGQEKPHEKYALNEEKIRLRRGGGERKVGVWGTRGEKECPRSRRTKLKAPPHPGRKGGTIQKGKRKRCISGGGLSQANSRAKLSNT